MCYRWPKYPVGPNAPPFPITVLCRNRYELDRLKGISGYIDLIYSTCGDNRQRICEELAKLKDRPILQDALGGSTHCFPVLYGNHDRELICLTW